MQISSTTIRKSLMASMVAVGLMAGVGCQSDIGGQTLPSAYFLDDDVQYFAEGHEFKLQREADAMEQIRAEQELRQGR
ncbi:MAG: hypothetical protein WD045_09960 [Pirellulaceae bacterium]